MRHLAFELPAQKRGILAAAYQGIFSQGPAERRIKDADIGRLPYLKAACLNPQDLRRLMGKRRKRRMKAERPLIDEFKGERQERLERRDPGLGGTERSDLGIPIMRLMVGADSPNNALREARAQALSIALVAQRRAYMVKAIVPTDIPIR